MHTPLNGEWADFLNDGGTGLPHCRREVGWPLSPLLQGHRSACSRETEGLWRDGDDLPLWWLGRCGFGRHKSERWKGVEGEQQGTGA